MGAKYRVLCPQCDWGCSFEGLRVPRARSLAGRNGKEDPEPSTRRAKESCIISALGSWSLDLLDEASLDASRLDAAQYVARSARSTNAHWAVQSRQVVPCAAPMLLCRAAHHICHAIFDVSK